MNSIVVKPEISPEMVRVHFELPLIEIKVTPGTPQASNIKHIISIIYLYIYIYESLTTLRLLGDTAPSKAARRWKMLSCSRMSFATVGSSVLLPREAGLSYHQLQPWGFVSQNSGIEDL